MWYFNVWIKNCDCFVDEYDNLIVYVDNVEIARELDCGLDKQRVFDILEEHGYL